MRSYLCRTVLLTCALLLLFVVYTGISFGFSDHLVWPEASGTLVLTDGSLTVDASHAEDGYIMVRGEPTDKRYKMRIILGKATMTYDVPSDGTYWVYPLQLGNGKYTVSLFKNASGKKYAEAGTVKSEFTLRDANAPFLCPNVYVDYTADSPAVAISEEICRGCQTDQAKFEAIQKYIVSNFEYDFAKAASVSDGVMPDMNHVLEDGMGICQDFATLTACMLRVQGIPVKFAIGYCGKVYHAWNYVTVDNTESLYDPTADIGGVKPAKYSLERYY